MASMIPFWPIVAPRLLSAISFVIEIEGMTVWPFVFSRHPMNAITTQHEGTHAAQQFECSMIQVVALFVMAMIGGPWWLLAVPLVLFIGGPLYLLLYYAAYAINLARFRGDGPSAYHAIFFEAEAYDNERDAGYNRRRAPFSWVRYLKGA